MKLDAQGNIKTSFGAGMFIFPHKLYIDIENNVWVVDGRGPNERELKANSSEQAKVISL
jgi:hypothetical protein